MNMHFSIQTFSKETTTFVSDIYQYWLVLEGSFRIGYDGQIIPFISHDMAVVPNHMELHLTISQTVVIGCIEITDFVTTNTQLQKLCNPDTELIRKIFFFGYDIQGIHRPHMAQIMTNIHSLMLEVLLSRSSTKTVNPYVLQVLEDINDNFLDSSYNLSEAVSNTGYSPSHFRKLFRSEVNLSPLEFLNNRRLDHAKKLMRQNPRLSIKDIALQSGYNDAYYFSRIFKKIEGKTPGEYIKSIHPQA